MPPESATVIALAPAQRGFVETEEAPSLLRDLGSGARYRGGLDGWRDGVLSGWAVDLAHPRRALPIALEAGGAVVADDVADRPRGDLADILPGNRAGFDIDLKLLSPAALDAIERALRDAPPNAPLDPKSLTLRLDGGGPRLDLGRYGLTGRKALTQCRAARGQIEAIAVVEAPRPAGEAGARPQRRGFDRAEFTDSDLSNLERGVRYRAGVDGLIGASLRGWAVDLTEPRAPAPLTLRVEGRAVFALATAQHRADIAGFIEDNVAGFHVDLAALPPEATAALIEALGRGEPNAPAPPEIVAIEVGYDGSLIDLGAFGVTLAELKSRIAPPKRALAPDGDAVRPAPATAPDHTVKAPVRRPPAQDHARALHWLLDYTSRDLPPPGHARPARRFAQYLAQEIERSTTVSATVKRHACDIASLFDPFYYLDRLDDPEEAIANPLLHYTFVGWREGRRGSAIFDPGCYRDRRGVVTGDPLLDFVREGARLDADPHPLFDMAYYRKRHLGGDETINPLIHYLEIGGRLRLDPSPLFDTSRFLEAFGLGEETEAPLEAYAANSAYHDFDLLRAFDPSLYRYQIEVERGERIDGPPVAHYLAQGYADETLLPNLFFDPAFYRERNKLDFAGPALLHYLREGRDLDCHPFFSPSHYDKQRGGAGEGLPALEHALANPGAFVSDPRMDAPIDARLVAFVRRLVLEKGESRFDPDTYLAFSPDLEGLDHEQLVEHYRHHGIAEGRPSSPSEAMKFGETRIRDLPLGFVLDDYVTIYQDLNVYRDRFDGAICHYALFGRRERRLVGKWRFRITDLELDLPTAHAPLQVLSRQERVEVAILIHAFYPELLPELIAFAQNFRNVSFDIFINIVDIAWTPEVQAEVRAICPGAFVMLSNDLGRDVGGFTRLLTEVDIARYDLFAFMHSKKSPHIAVERGEYWRKGLLRAIAGSPDIATDCVRQFRENPSVGLIGAQEWRSQDMGKNFDQYERLLDLLDVRGKNRELDYVSGFMFLVRGDVVARLYETLGKLDFEYGGDKDLDFHIDGQIAHGVERAVPALVRQMGYEVCYR